MREMTVKQYAAREQVTERTVRTWIAKGAIRVRRTPGGRVRVFVADPEPMKPDEEKGSAYR